MSSGDASGLRSAIQFPGLQRGSRGASTWGTASGSRLAIQFPGPPRRANRNVRRSCLWLALRDPVQVPNNAYPEQKRVLACESLDRVCPGIAGTRCEWERRLGTVSASTSQRGRWAAYQ